MVTAMRAERRPNILLILTDQQRGDCLGLAGHPVLETPAMDFIGHSGSFFQRAYSECPHCIPARRTIMSGLSPAAHGMLVNAPGQDWNPAHTLAGELRQAGYQTEMIGKLHLWPHRKRYGFDHLLLADSTRGANNDYVEWLGGAAPLERWAVAHGVTPNGWLGRPTHLPESQTHAFWCVSEAITFLHRRDHTVPFFLNVSFIDPHPPLSPPEYLFNRYEARTLPQPVVGDWAPDLNGPIKGLDPEAMLSPEGYGAIHLDDQQMHHCRAAYFGLISHVDYQISRLLQFLREAKLLDDTFILFASDHGEMLGDHHLFHKTRPFEPSARVPLLARPPRSWGYPSGVVVDAPVGLQDIMPTLLDAAGAPIPDSLTGRSLLPLMGGERPPWRDVLHGECTPRGVVDDGAMHYLVDGRWKYIWYSQTGREMLFDLQEDPGELHDLSGGSAAAGFLRPWRRRLVQELRGRPEGFVTNDQLVSGRPHGPLVPGVAG
jgi:arylsulfatase